MNIKLKGVEETLLITVQARALETKRKDSLLQDPFAVEMVKQLGGEKIKVSKPSQIGIIVRTLLLDSLVSQFISKYPQSNIINLGCGLDARHLRLGKLSKELTWYDLDYPVTIDLRKRFFEETANYQMIGQSFLDFTWIQSISQSKRPTFVLLEGVIMYLSAADFQQLLNRVYACFPYLEIAFDIVSPFVAKNTKIHPDVKKYDTSFGFGLRSAQILSLWNKEIKVLSEESFMIQHHLQRWPLYMLFLRKIPWVKNFCRVVHLGR